MTDFPLSPGNTMRPWRSPWGTFPIRPMALSTGISSAVIRIGQLVGLDVNSTRRDRVVPSSLSSNVVLSTAIVGLAAEAPGLGGASTPNTAGTVIPIWEANPFVEFRVHTRKDVLSSTLVGEVRDLEWDSTLFIHLVNVGAPQLTTAQPRVLITGLIDNPGDSGGAISVRFLTRDPTFSLATSTGVALAPKLLAFYA